MSRTTKYTELTYSELRDSLLDRVGKVMRGETTIEEVFDRLVYPYQLPHSYWEKAKAEYLESKGDRVTNMKHKRHNKTEKRLKAMGITYSLDSTIDEKRKVSQRFVVNAKSMLTEEAVELLAEWLRQAIKTADDKVRAFDERYA